MSQEGAAGVATGGGDLSGGGFTVISNDIVINIIPDLSAVEAANAQQDALEKVGKEKIDQDSANLALYFHVAANMISSLVDLQSKSLAIHIAESVISVGLTGAAMFRLGVSISEAAVKQQWVKVALYSILLSTMGINLVRTQKLKWEAYTTKQMADSLRSATEMYESK